MQYYIHLNNNSIGPMSADQVVAYPVTTDTPVSANGGEWKPLLNYPELMQRLSHTHSQNSNPYFEAENKKTVCGILAMLFGAFGIQYFYLGRVGAGFLTILLSLVTCGLWEIVTFIQGILMLTMSPQEFQNKYIDSTSTLPLF